LKEGTPNLEIFAMSRNRIEDAGAIQVSLNTNKNLLSYLYEKYNKNKYKCFIINFKFIGCRSSLMST